MQDTEPQEVWNPPGRTRRERRVDRLQVVGAIVIALLLVVAAVATLI